MKTMLRATAILIAVVCLTRAGQAGIILQQQGRQPETSDQASTGTYYIESGKLRVEFQVMGSEFVMIFDQSRPVIWVIDRQRNTYHEMTSAHIEIMDLMLQKTKQLQTQLAQMQPEQRARVEQMMDEVIEKQLAQMPPTQRAILKQLLSGIMHPEAAPAVTIQVKREDEKIGQYVCTLYEVLTNGQRTAEVWMAPFEDAMLQEPEYQTYKAMEDFYKPLTQIASRLGWNTPDTRELDGFPVRWRTYRDDRLVVEWEVIKTERKNRPDDLFVLPADLQKMDEIF